MQFLFNSVNNDTDLDFSVTWHNQFLDGQDKILDFDLSELLFDRYSHPPHILQAKEVVPWTPSCGHCPFNKSS